MEEFGHVLLDFSHIQIGMPFFTNELNTFSSDACSEGSFNSNTEF